MIDVLSDGILSPEDADLTLALFVSYKILQGEVVFFNQRK